MTGRTEQSAVSLGDFAGHVATALEELDRSRVVARIWAGDHTVWREDPTEIADRLGWLHVLPEMRDQIADLQAFANTVRQDGIRHVVLLGMGGSSLGPEVIRQVLHGPESHPELIVLDSTVPSWISWVDAQIKPDKTLFLVSSKSGGTIEPNSLYKYFRRSVERATTKAQAGSHFVAVTDAGTSLEQLATERGFRRTFLNRPDIGGRYSVLSYFGLVPAALSGVDLPRLLGSAEEMAASCRAEHVTENPGAWLGAFMAGTALNGRDKLTIFTSPALSAFGLWAEQLIAESTGKDGKGIAPVVGEPVLGPESYGDDRAFVYLRLEGDANATADVAMERLAAVGHPIVRLDLRDRHDIGAEFFRWEMAVAVAGSLLGIHPFDQPNVQSAKDATNQVLAEYEKSGSLPQLPAGDGLATLLDQASPNDYLALLLYAQPTEDVNSLLAELRRQVMDRYQIATTVGYGPRYLHSTGQLHKGGPNTGLFAHLTTKTDRDVTIPGAGYSFGTLVAAQAIGDYQALVGAGRRVVHIDIGRDAEAGILRLLASI